LYSRSFVVVIACAGMCSKTGCRWSFHRLAVSAANFVLPLATPKNGHRMEEYIKAAKLDSTNVDHLHQAAKALESRGLLQLDLSKIPVAPRQKYTEEDLYEMPWPHLEKLARKSGL